MKDGLSISKDIQKEIAQAFENCQVALETAGGKGWSQVRARNSSEGESKVELSSKVYRITSYHVVLNDEVMQVMVSNLKKWAPDHAPIWTCIGVKQLASDNMKVEIEVVAHIGP